MFTKLRKGLMRLDRWNDKRMHYHDLNNQCIKSLLKKRIYSWGLGRSINMKPSYHHKTLRRNFGIFRHRWCGIGFHRDSKVKILALHIPRFYSHPNICWYEMSMVGWLCIDHNLVLVRST